MKEQQLIEEMREEFNQKFLYPDGEIVEGEKVADWWIEKLKLYHQAMTDEFWRKRNEDIDRSGKEPKNIIAFCPNCGIDFTEWLSDSKECPECEGRMVFKDLL